jgi:predicted transposase YbfD/YdcC
LRWVGSTAETLCCVGARSVVEVTREVTILAGKDKGKCTKERVLYVSSLEKKPDGAKALLGTIREYWEIEGCLHQRLDVTAREDASRVRNRNSLLVLGILRRSVMGIYEAWKRRRKNQRQSTLKDFHDAMNAFNHRQAFTKLNPRP